MDVDFVTSPILELPTLKTAITKMKYSNEAKQFKQTTIKSTKSTLSTPTPLSTSWISQSATSLPLLSDINQLVTTKKVKGKTKKGFTQQLKSKIEGFTKALGKSVKFKSDHPQKKEKLKKPANISVANNNAYYWEDEFDRYKRFKDIQELKLPIKMTPDNVNKATTQELNYYSIFKNKMKHKLFVKKATGPLDSLTTDAPFTAETCKKDVEITVINFDDIENLTSHESSDTFESPTLTRNEIGTFANYGVTIMPTIPDNAIISSKLSHKEKGIHNGLLYKDALKDLTKSTQYGDPIVNDGPATIHSNNIPINQYTLEKIPIDANVLRKMSHTKQKNFNNGPKRVHISSHHYKYDVFYDDIKRPEKILASEGCGYSLNNLFSGLPQAIIFCLRLLYGN